jgi:hypothetical protein
MAQEVDLFFFKRLVLGRFFCGGLGGIEILFFLVFEIGSIGVERVV